MTFTLYLVVLQIVILTVHLVYTLDVYNNPISHDDILHGNFEESKKKKRKGERSLREENEIHHNFIKMLTFARTVCISKSAKRLPKHIRRPKPNGNDANGW